MSGRGRARAPPTKGIGFPTTTFNYPAPKVSAPPPTTPELIRRYEARFFSERMSPKMEVPRLGCNFRPVSAQNLRDVADGLAIEATPKIEHVVANGANGAKMESTTMHNEVLAPNFRQILHLSKIIDSMGSRIGTASRRRCIFDLGPKTPTLADVVKPKERHMTPKESPAAPKEVSLPPKLVTRLKTACNDLKPAQRCRCIFDLGPKTPVLAQGVKSRIVINGVNKINNDDQIVPKVKMGGEMNGFGTMTQKIQIAQGDACLFDLDHEAPVLAQVVQSRVAKWVNEINNDDNEMDGFDLKSTATKMTNEDSTTNWRFRLMTQRIKLAMSVAALGVKLRAGKV